MYKNKKENKKNNQFKNVPNNDYLDQSLEKAIETIRRQSLSYHHAGMTHISSLLD